MMPTITVVVMDDDEDTDDDDVDDMICHPSCRWCHCAAAGSDVQDENKSFGGKRRLVAMFMEALAQPMPC